MNYYDQMFARGAINNGAVLLQSEGSIGGQRHVFVGLEGAVKEAFRHPPIGGLITNPFKGPAKIYAGDLIEHDLGLANGKGATVKILKSYKVGVATSTSTDTAIYLERNGFVHIPFVGDVLMVAGATFATKGKGVTVVAVEETVKEEKDVWKVTLSATLGNLTAGTVLVEAAEAGDSVLPMVTNPNCFAPSDYDFPFYALAGSDSYHTPRLLNTFCMLGGDVVMWKDKMSPVPPAVLAMNKSLYAEFWHI